jgi:hypothetical protein
VALFSVNVNVWVAENLLFGGTTTRQNTIAFSLQHVAVSASKKFSTQASETPPGK